MSISQEAKERFIEEAVVTTRNFLLDCHSKLDWKNHVFVNTDSLHLIEDDEYELLYSQLGKNGSCLSRFGQILINIKPKERVDYYGNVNKYHIESTNDNVKAFFRTVLCADLIPAMLPIIAKVVIPKKVPDSVYDIVHTKLCHGFPPPEGMPLRVFRQFRPFLQNAQLTAEDGLLIGTGCKLAWSLDEQHLSGYCVQIGERFDTYVVYTIASSLTRQFVYRSVKTLELADRLLRPEHKFAKSVKDKLEKLAFSFKPKVHEANNPLIGYCEGLMLNRILKEMGRKDGKITLEEYLNPSFPGD